MPGISSTNLTPPSFSPRCGCRDFAARGLKNLKKKATQLDSPFEKNKWRRNNWDKLGSRNTWTLSHRKWSLIHTSLFSETTICWQLRKETWLVYFSWFFSAFLARRGTTLACHESWGQLHCSDLLWHRGAKSWCQFNVDWSLWTSEHLGWVWFDTN